MACLMLSKSWWGSWGTTMSHVGMKTFVTIFSTSTSYGSLRWLLITKGKTQTLDKVGCNSHLQLKHKGVWQYGHSKNVLTKMKAFKVKKAVLRGIHSHKKNKIYTSPTSIVPTPCSSWGSPNTLANIWQWETSTTTTPSSNSPWPPSQS